MLKEFRVLRVRAYERSFNSLLEMHHKGWLYQKRSKERFNSLLEMRRAKWREELRGVSVFQFSIGDASLLCKADLLFDLQRVSILYWRCLGSLQIWSIWSSSRVSILYWRCNDSNLYRHGIAVLYRFNSLLEMPGLTVFWMCGFLSFLYVFLRGSV